MNKVIRIIAKELREALPAVIFFMVLFHLIALTKAVSLHDYHFTALHAFGATVGALLVAKAILIVEALPVTKFSSGRLIYHVLWKTALYVVLTLILRVLEEIIPLLLKYKSLENAIKAMYHEVNWGLFGVMTLWILGGLSLYCLGSELVRAIGPKRINEILFKVR